MKVLTLMAIGTVLMLTACQKTPDTDQLSNNFAVQTSKDPNANFTTYATFYISDTIKKAASDPKDTVWHDAQSAQLVKAVKDNMIARGYSFVSASSKPNLGLSLTAIKDLNLGVIYPGWWWGYWGGCYWGYCGYPPYYPWGGGIVYSIPTGTLVLDMVDLKNASATAKLSAPWGSVMSGGLGNTANDLQLGINAINQAFTQSPYLHK